MTLEFALDMGKRNFSIDTLTSKLKEKCPLLSSILCALVTSDAEINTVLTNEKKTMNAAHVLNFLSLMHKEFTKPE